MMKGIQSAAILLALATSTYAQFDFSDFSGSSNNNNNNNDDNGNGNNGNSNSFSSGSGDFDFGSFGNVSRYRAMLIAHAVLATVAFGFFFPVGGILIRLASFPGLWLVHALIQIFAWFMYIAAFVIGIYLARASPVGLYDRYHPIIGYVLMALLLFQPFCGYLHHAMFKKHNRRVFWSYAHVWLGRIIITLGIINGGLGLMFAMEYPLLPPSQAAIIGYSVPAGVMWLFYVFAIIIGEGRRRRKFDTATAGYKDEYDSSRSRERRNSRARSGRRSGGSGSNGGSGGRRGSRYSKSQERRRYA